MGAVQKLATVVIIGLVALATVLTVYIAREPDRRDEELTEQEQVAITRGTQLYITFCLQCHGPAGLGAVGNEENPRIGPPLNQIGAGVPKENLFYQSDDPVQQQLAEDLIRFRVTYGAPPDPRQTEKIMPSFRNDLSEEQIDELVTLIMEGDWDYVYNQAVLQTGQQVAQAACHDEADEEGEAEECDHIEPGDIEAPPIYPTAPAPEVADPGETAAGENTGQDAPAEEGVAADADAETADVVLEAIDPYEWSETEPIVAPGSTITAVNAGSLEHNFTVDELGIAEDLPTDGTNVTITIPEDAEPGQYEFYCSVPGHREGGMVGTLIVEESSS
ncbi:MAG TPA: c-type cytochrome [Thermomicrobiales bacterium]|nr:c-type cytochrome [Thermomicrobiales bacterium]